MTDKRPRTTQVTELKHLGRTFRHGRKIVTIRCNLIAGPRGRRFEIVMWANGSRAVIDMPGSAEAELAQRISTATEAFLAAITLRGDARS
jgi:hypothetical protein